MPPETPQVKTESQTKFSNNKIIETFDVKPGKATIGHIADALKIKSDKLQELFGNKHFSGMYQKNTKGITELKDPKGFFFSEPRNDDIYALNHTDQGYTLNRIRNGKEFFVVIPSEYIKPHEINHTGEELAQLSEDIKNQKRNINQKTTVK